MKKLIAMSLASLSLLLGSTVYAEEDIYEPTKLLPKDNYTSKRDYTIFSGITRGKGNECILVVELSTFENMDNPDVYASNTVECGERVSVTVPKLSNNTWYWRAYTDYREGYSDYSEVRTFKMSQNNQAPNISLIEIENSDDGINLTANVSDPRGDNIRLQFEVSQDPNFNSYTTYYTGYEKSNTEVERSIGKLDKGVYYLKVKAHDDWDYSFSNYSNVKEFKIE